VGCEVLREEFLGAFFSARPKKTGLCGTPLSLRPRLAPWLLRIPSIPCAPRAGRPCIQGVAMKKSERLPVRRLERAFFRHDRPRVVFVAAFVTAPAIGPIGRTSKLSPIWKSSHSVTFKKTNGRRFNISVSKKGTGGMAKKSERLPVRRLERAFFCHDRPRVVFVAAFVTAFRFAPPLTNRSYPWTNLR
jgi:hypothetical protein